MMHATRRSFTRLGKVAAALALGLLLAACASTSSQPGSPERFQEGREAYLAGDYSRAFELLIREAEDGNPDAQYTVGYMYYNGEGVQQDEAAALRWIRTAANNGSRRAVEALGQMAGMGPRTPRSEAVDEDGGAPDRLPHRQ